MSGKTKSVKCVRDIRDFNLMCFRLSSDGEKWKSLASQREKLFGYLATFADGDGTNIKVGTARMVKKMEPLSRATTFRRLDDLEVIGVLLPVIEDGKKLTGEHGTRFRKI